MCCTKRIVAGLTLLAALPVSRAGAEGWSLSFGPPGTKDGLARVFHEWNGTLVAGGGWSQIGSLRSDGIAWFDGEDWRAFGEGIGQVYAIATYEGDLIVGGYALHDGWPSLPRVARWNGVRWSKLAASTGPSDIVRSLIVHEGELYAAGDFTHADGALVNGVARWNGVGWESVGGGLPGGSVRKLVVYDGQLLAGGEFVSTDGTTPSYLAVWDGLSWSPFAGGTDDAVYGFMRRGNDLWMAGDFQVTGGVETGPVAIWDGATWSGTEPGLSGLAEMLVEYRGEVYGGMRVSNATSSARSQDGLYRWSGEVWETIADVLPHVGYVWNDELLLGGGFIYINGAPAFGVARYDGTETTGFCPGYGVGPWWSIVDNFAVWGDKLVVLGNFNVAGCARSRGVAIWDGAWQPLGSGVEFAARDAVGYEGDLIVGGAFPSADGVLVNNIGRWNGTNWSALDTGLSAGVLALAVYQDDLYAAGRFTHAGSTVATYVARWDGTSWYPVGDGLQTSSPWWPTVLDLHVWNDLLVVCGDFHTAGGVPAKSLAAWDGASWQELGGGVTGGRVNRLTTYKGDLLASGSFTSAGDTGFDRLARWTGMEWIDEGQTLPAGASIGQTAAVGEVLYAVGGGGALGRGAVRRVGWTWQTLADEPVYQFFACVAFGDGVYYGGDFEWITDDIKSAEVARWDLDPPTPIDPVTPEVPPGFQGTLLVLPPRPNPSDGVIRISFGIDHVGIVEARVFDTGGRLVRDLTAADSYAPGTHTLEWDGRTDAGRTVPDGVYFARLTTAGRSETRKIVISR